MKKQFATIFIAVVAVVVIFLNRREKSSATVAEPDALASHIDSSVKPQDDFFMFANGKWFKQNPIPNSERQNGIFQMINDTINAQIHNLCETAAKLTNAESGSAKQKIGDFYYTAMDSVTLNKNGINDLKPEVEKIDGIKDMKTLFQEAGYITSVGTRPFFSFEIAQDDKISSKHVVHIEQGGLSLPNRSYYFDMDTRTVGIREKFVEHVKNMFVIMGYDEAKAKLAANNMMKLETAIAKTSRKREDTRDPLKNYTKVSYKQLCDMAPNFDWQTFFTSCDLSNVDSAVVCQPEFMT
ncbi:MAG TPA: M13 family metallopeptidase N-terminal domain-containing protein, partial [Bacteroidia bacterium]|nr:M13 family metallopeptidase N-terminal domain-containing protein [Bacteroidia bacterium]